MLTIKVIRPDLSEFVEEVTSVALNNSNQSASGWQSVTYFIPNVPEANRAVDVYEGIVYVMNEAGKTIAKYDICPIK